jgi:hypothetical protein
MLRIIFKASLILLISVNAHAGKGEGVSDTGFLTSMSPESPEPCNPLDEKVIETDSVTIAWYSTPHASEYTLQVSEQELFTTLVLDETITDTCYTYSPLTDSLILYWRVSGSNIAGQGPLSEVRSFTTQFPSETSATNDLMSNSKAFFSVSPNPFRKVTRITFQLKSPSDFSLRIFNNAGQFVHELAAGTGREGIYTLEWRGCNIRGAPVPTGAYHCILRIGDEVFTRKLLVHNN